MKEAMIAPALTHGSGVQVESRASSRTTPRGLPRWRWLLGVTVSPLRAAEADGNRAWIVSGGSGLAFVTAVFFETDQD